MWVHEKLFQSAVLWVLWFFFMIAQCGSMSLLNSYLWRIYQTFFVNGLAGYHQMMSKQRFCTNLNSFLPKVNLNCACVLCWFQLFLSDHLAEKRKRIAGRKVAYKEIDLKFLYFFFPFFFFYIALYCTNGGMRLSPFS